MSPFGFERIVEDYEARLAPVPGARIGADARGKSEWERYGSGGEEFNVRVRKLDVPDETVLDVVLNDVAVGQVTIRRGWGKLLIRSRDGAVPKASEGDKIVLLRNDTAILHGTFVPD